MAKKPMIITDCMVYSPEGWGALNLVDVQYNGVTKWFRLTSFLGDEISVDPKKLTGLTKEEALEHILKKEQKFWAEKEKKEEASRRKHAG